ncbi:MAG: HEAT repeat domain-containing protein [Solirubrobacteraceae bacterium]
MALVRKRPGPALSDSSGALSDPRAALSSPDPEQRRAGAVMLMDVEDAKQLLAEHVAIEQDVVVREAMLTALVGCHDVAAARILATLLRGEDAALRNAVADTLGRMPAAGAIIEELLVDQDPDVRVMSVMLLRSLALPAVPQWLLEVVARDTDANVVGGALGELAEVGDATMISVLERAPARFPGDPFIAFSAAVAVARLRESI